MYIRITSRCNMRCEHCCASWLRGGHMERDTFKAALHLAEEYGEEITIGGGEPTVHPEFWDFLGLALISELCFVSIITNGKRKKDALRLLKLSQRRENLSASLSANDGYHESADPEVYAAYAKDRNFHTVTTVYPEGRGKNVATEEEGCVCPDLCVMVDGKVRYCGCQKSPAIGDVWSGIVLPHYEDQPDEPCCRNLKRGWRRRAGK